MEKSENTTVEEQISKKPRIQNEEHIEPIVVNDPLKKKDKGKEKVVEEHKVDKEKDFRSDLHTSTEKGRKKERSESSERVQRMDLVILAEKPKRTLAEGEGESFLVYFFEEMLCLKMELDLFDSANYMVFSRVSKEIFGWAKKFIEHHFWFAPKDNLKWYSPKKLRILFPNDMNLLASYPLLPTHLEFLLFSNRINLPLNLAYLSVGDIFNSPFDFSQCRCLHTLLLGKSFSQALTSLPTSLEDLTLGSSFRAEINYPPYLKKLTIESEERRNIQKIEFQKIRNIITLEELTFPDYFDQDLESILPPHLKKLSFGFGFNTLIKMNTLPFSIQGILFPPLYKFPVDSFPPNLTHLELSERVESLKDENWPLRLKVLKVGFIPPLFVSCQLEELSFSTHFNEPIKKKIFQTPIKILTFSEYFDQSVNNLPRSLIQLSFGRFFNQKVNNLPDTLRTLTFGEKFNQNIEKLPALLMELRFGKTFNSVVTQYPPMLTVLHYGEEYQKAPTLPQTLQKLIFPCFGKVYETEEKKVAFKEALPWLINFLHE